jgi:glycosyltransferase involved in cell wall biosynthesis
MIKISTNKKVFWLINQYASTPETGIGGRHYSLARELAKQGHDVYLIAASYTHLLRKPPNISEAFSIQDTGNFKFVWVKLPNYSEAHSKQRVLNWFLFAWKLRKLPTIIPDKPHAILYSSPSLVGSLGAHWLADHFQVPLTFEVRDIWPLTLMEIGGYSPHHPLILFLQWVEDRAYRDSKRVVSNLKNAVNHMVSRGMDPLKFSWIPNGFSLNDLVNTQPLSVNVEAFIPRGKFIVGYTGTFGMANALDTLIEAADLLKSYPNIVFILVGEGSEKQRLLDLKKKKGLTNIIFIDSIPKVQIQSMLARFDVCYIGWRKKALYRFGIAANKIFEYFYSSKPIIHAYSGECDPVKEYKAGLIVPAENPKAIGEAILQIEALSPEERHKMGSNGHRYVVENHEYGTLARKLSKLLVEENVKAPS